MGKYLIDFTQAALNELQKHKKAGNKNTLNKLKILLEELEKHPYLGQGKPEALKHQLSGYWSREINRKDRLVYKVLENNIVEVTSVMGHYSDR